VADGSIEIFVLGPGIVCRLQKEWILSKCQREFASSHLLAYSLSFQAEWLLEYVTSLLLLSICLKIRGWSSQWTPHGVPHPIALVDSRVTPLPVVNSGPIQKWTVAIAFPASPLADHSTPYTAFSVPSLIMIRFVRFQANRSSKPRFSQPLHFRVRSLSAGGLRPKPTLYEHTKILRCSEPEMPLSKEISRRSVTWWGLNFIIR
jgi:hypothetical protein